MLDKMKYLLEKIGIDIAGETRTDVDGATILEVGMQMYHDQFIGKLKPSFNQLVKTLDGRINRNTISMALDILADTSFVDLSLKNKYQPALTSEGTYFFKSAYEKVIKA